MNNLKPENKNDLDRNVGHGSWFSWCPCSSLHWNNNGLLASFSSLVIGYLLYFFFLLSQEHILPYVIFSVLIEHFKICYHFSQVSLWVLCLFKWLTYIRHCPHHFTCLNKLWLYTIIILFYIALFSDDLHL